MRRTFADELLKHARLNPDIVVVTGDLGYKVWDQLRAELPNQFINAGAAEQAACGICIGLAQSGKLPVFYSITTFLLYRPFELIRNYIDHEKAPVLLIGSGRDKDYAHDGISHWSEDDSTVMDLFPNIECHWPLHKEEIPQILNSYVVTPRPVYINLKR